MGLVSSKDGQENIQVGPSLLGSTNVIKLDNQDQFSLVSFLGSIADNIFNIDCEEDNPGGMEGLWIYENNPHLDNGAKSCSLGLTQSIEYIVIALLILLIIFMIAAIVTRIQSCLGLHNRSSNPITSCVEKIV